MGKDLKGKELGIGLTQRKDGRYSAKYTNKAKKRKEKYFDKLSDAKDWLLQEKYSDKALATSDMLVDDWYQFWIHEYKENQTSDNTIKGYKIRYNYNIKSAIGNMKLNDVKQIHCQSIINKMHDSGKYSQGTMELTQITLHSLFKAAVENEYILLNPADGVNFKFKDTCVNKERRVLTVIEQDDFLKYAEHTMYGNAYRLILLTGMRIGEVGGLRWTDIDFDKKCIHIQRTLLQAREKGGFYFGEPKTKTSKRIIPLKDSAIVVLQDQKLFQEKLKARSTRWHSEFDGIVFTTVNGNPVGASTFNGMLARIVANINADRQIIGNNEVFVAITPHTLRHSFATRCIENGMQPKVLQKILGHSNLATTMDLYVHVTDDTLFSECEKIVG